MRHISTPQRVSAVAPSPLPALRLAVDHPTTPTPPATTPAKPSRIALARARCKLDPLTRRARKAVADRLRAMRREGTAPPAVTLPSFGARLRKARKLSALTMAELGALADFSKPYLSLLETERVPPPPVDLKVRRLELAMGLQPFALIAHAHLARVPPEVVRLLQYLAQPEPRPAPRGEAERAYLAAALAVLRETSVGPAT